MNRFQQTRQSSLNRGLVTTILIFVVVLGVLIYAVNALSKDTEERQKAALEAAVRNTSVYCYSIEGAYPSDVEYLEKNYGLTYDKDLFYVGYRLQGSNMMPEITIVELGK